MTELQVSTPSSEQFLAFCVLSAVGALLVVIGTGANAWFLFPIGLSILAVLSFLDAFWTARS